MLAQVLLLPKMCLIMPSWEEIRQKSFDLEMENIMSKKTILLVIDNMKIGGIQKNMLNLLTELNDLYDLTLCVFNPVGEYMSLIPQNVKVIETKSAFRYLGMSNADAKKKLSDFIGRTFYYVIMRLFGNKTLYKCMLKTQKNLGSYDYAISGMQSAVSGVFYSGCNELILNKVTANEKIAYIHCDYVLSGIDNSYNRSVYRLLDKVLVPNRSNFNQLVSVLPDIKQKVHIVNNFCNYDEVHTKAEIDPLKYDKNKINIVTVARISPEKGIDRAIHVFHRLKNAGYAFTYHVVGGGGNYEELCQFVKDNGLTDHIFLHGYDSNPYKYIKNADLFLLPSRNEAAGLVIDEARSLGVPVLSTRTVAAEETLAQHDCGWVCENSDDGLYDGITRLLDNFSIVEEKSAVLKETQANNSIPIAQFAEMLE